MFACCYSVKKKVAVVFDVFKALTVRGPGHTSSSQQLVHMFLHKYLRMTIGRTGVNTMFGVCQSEAVCRTRGSIEWKFLLQLPLHLLAGGSHSRSTQNYTVLILTTRRPSVNIYARYFVYERHFNSLERVSVNVSSVPLFEILEKV